MRLVIHGLPPTMTDPEIRHLFAVFGPVDRVEISRDEVTGDSYGFAFVEIG